MTLWRSANIWPGPFDAANSKPAEQAMKDAQRDVEAILVKAGHPLRKSR